MSVPPFWAPALTMLQNASPLEPWVTTAILKPYLPPPPLPVFVVCLLTAFLLLHAPSRITGTSRAAASTARLLRIMRYPFAGWGGCGGCAAIKRRPLDRVPDVHRYPRWARFAAS